MECRDLEKTLPVMTDVLAFERVGAGPGTVTLKHPNTPWLLVAHEAGPDAPEKPSWDHFGVRVEHKSEVDAAWRYVNDRKDELGLYDLKEPTYGHGSYSLHFREPGSNDWEIECYEDVLRKESGATRLGGVRSRHWDAPLDAEGFERRGYVPQAFTHGTMSTADAPAYIRFLNEVLGLDAHQAYSRVVYAKHPATKHFVVCLERGARNELSPNFRFTVTVESPEEVANAYRWLGTAGRELGVADLSELETQDGGASFLLWDGDRNCWELAAR
jgi:catechol 2,3-dioxygenase-like lactoylglutathione lyase family enzyme